MNDSITIESLEQLANEMEAEDAAERARLRRLIAAYSRIIYVRGDGKFHARPVEVSDEDGHWDNSYPPAIKYKDFSGPALLQVRRGDYDTVATETGFYHEWRAVTSDHGLYVDRCGDVYGREYTGTGRFGQFAAHPGSCCVQLTVEYDLLDEEELTLDDYRTVEQHLRDVAFPLVAAARKMAND